MKKMKKKALFCVTLTILLFILFMEIKLNVDAGSVDDFKYESNGTRIKITGYVGESMQVVIPKEIENLPVTEIGINAFYNLSITSVDIPDSVITIGNNGFAMNQLTTIDLPTQLTSIGSSAFNNNKITSLIIPETVTRIGNYSFAHNDIASVSLPSNLTTIEKDVFMGNELSSVTIPNTVISIGEQAFSNNKLTSVTIPSHITRLEAGVFNDNLLTTFVMPEGVTYIGKDAFKGNRLTSMVIPDTVMTVGEGAFSNNQLTNVILPRGMTEIPNNVLHNNKLSSISIPTGVTRIGEYAFSENLLENLEIPDNVATIDSQAFSRNKITTTIIPEGTTFIGNNAFSNNQLTSIVIPDSVTTLGSSAFYINQLTSVDIPDHFTRLEPYVFAKNNLISVILPSQITNIGRAAFEENQLTGLTLPNSVTTLEQDAFRRNKLTSIVISDNVTSIGTSVFANNELTSVTLPSNLTSLSDYLFYDNKLTSIKISNGVKTIGMSAFSQNMLANIVIPSHVETIEAFAFSKNKLKSLIIPNSVTNIGIFAFSDNELESVSLPANLTKLNSGVFIRNRLTSLVIPNSVTFIGENSFASNKLRSITISNNATEIGNYAFYDSEITQVIIPSSVMKIDSHAFASNYLKKVEFRGSTVVDSQAFQFQNHDGTTFVDWYKESTFEKKWDFNTNVIVPDTILYAKWVVYLSFVSNAVDTPASQQVIVNTVAKLPAFISKKGYTLAGWTKDEGTNVLWDFNDVITENMTLYAKWIPNKHTVTFNTNGGSAVTALSDVSYDSAISIPKIPTRTDYTFGGWYKESGLITEWNFTNDRVVGDTTLYAKWLVKENTYTVSFNANGGSSVASLEDVPGNTKVTAPAAPTKVGYTFDGWYKQASLTTAWSFTADSVVGNTTLYAKWKTNHYTVSFNANGGSVVASLGNVAYNTKVTAPTAPTRVGYTFDGWYKQASLTTVWSFTADSVVGNTTLYAKWLVKENTYTVSFNANGGSNVASLGNVPYNTKVTAPTAPTKVGYTFDGWYKEASLTTVWSFTADNVVENITLYAKWTPNHYTVSFNVNGGSNVASLGNVPYNTKVIAPAAPTRVGYTFDGWYKEASLTTVWNFTADSVVGNTTLYAKWIVNDYTVSFNANGGSTIASLEGVPYNTKVIAPEVPTRVGHTFDGWYKESGLKTEWDFTADNVVENITLYAKWIVNDYTVSFNANGGSNVASLEDVPYNTKVTVPAVPTKVGHVFDGWYKNTALTLAWDFENDVVVGDMTLYAKWITNDYTVNFNTNGGSTIASLEGVPYNTKVIAPEVPTRVGHTFDGWYKESGLITEWDFTNDNVVGDTTLYAKWITNDYTVNFNTNGGSVVASLENVPYNSKVTAPEAPTRVGHTFDGWYKNTALTLAWDFENDAVKEDTVLYARWVSNSNAQPDIVIRHTLSFVSNGGNIIADIIVEGNTLVKLPTPIRVGYTFDGWYIDDKLTVAWDISKDTVTESKVLYAKWIENGLEEEEEPKQPVVLLDISSHWAQKMIEAFVAKGLLVGYGDGNFYPNNPMKRLHIALVLNRSFDLISVRAEVPFVDVPYTHKHYTEIMKLQRAGIIDGSNGRFEPDSSLTRAQLAKILVLAYGVELGGMSDFKDVPMSHWGYMYISALAEHGIVFGNNGKFYPNVPVTRAEAVAMMYRAMALKQ